MPKIKFEGLIVDIDQFELDKDYFEVDFNGDMKVAFERQDDDQIVAINAVDGWGMNISEQVSGKAPIILED